MWLVFYMWLVVAAVCDAIYRKCYNWLVITGVFMAFVAVISVPESLPVPINLQDRLIGMLFGFFVFFVSDCDFLLVVPFTTEHVFVYIGNDHSFIHSFTYSLK